MLRLLAAMALCAMICLSCPAIADDAPDASTPKGAATAFFKAMENGDAAAAKTMASGSEKQLAILDILVPVVQGSKQLENAAVKKWGEEGRKTLTQGEGAPNLNFSEKIKTAREEISGDSATIVPAQPRPDDKEPMKLKKIEGKWKMDMSSIPSEGLDDPKTGKMLKSVAEIAKTTAAEIDQGKYADAKSAKEAMGKRILAALGVEGAPAEPPKK